MAHSTVTPTHSSPISGTDAAYRTNGKGAGISKAPSDGFDAAHLRYFEGDDSREPGISIRDVSLNYHTGANQVTALSHANLDIAEGEFVCLLGPSGCGKSTLLKILAGFLQPSEGEVLVHGAPVKGPDWNRGVVFQQAALYPWLNIEDNVRFGLKMRGIPREEQDRLVTHYLEKIGLLDFRKHRPYELSGGMKQRVSIARVLVNNPLIMLMDEPFGALDALTREGMQKLVRDIWWETRRTVLFITHDVDEALSLGTRVIVMSARPGRIVKEFRPNFTLNMTGDDADTVRYTQAFREMREAVLDLIHHVHTEYTI